MVRIYSLPHVRYGRFPHRLAAALFLLSQLYKVRRLISFSSNHDGTHDFLSNPFFALAWSVDRYSLTISRRRSSVRCPPLFYPAIRIASENSTAAIKPNRIVVAVGGGSVESAENEYTNGIIHVLIAQYKNTLLNDSQKCPFCHSLTPSSVPQWSHIIFFFFNIPPGVSDFRMRRQTG